MHSSLPEAAPQPLQMGLTPQAAPAGQQAEGPAGVQGQGRPDKQGSHDSDSGSETEDEEDDEAPQAAQVGLQAVALHLRAWGYAPVHVPTLQPCCLAAASVADLWSAGVMQCMLPA